VPDEVKEEIKEKNEILVDPAAIEQLMSMGFERAMCVRALQRFPKPEQEIQRIEWILSDPPEEKDRGRNKKVVKKRILQRIPSELQKLFALLQGANQKAVSTEKLTTSFGWTANVIREQHDVHELNRILFEAIEKALLNTSGKSLIQDIYGGVLVNKTICTQCKTVSENKESFQVCISSPSFCLISFLYFVFIFCI
jgi:uncharacterized UBP type Zn finger protein